MKRWLGIFLAALLSAATTSAQTPNAASRLLDYSYDLDSAAFTYPLLAPSRAGIGRIKTTGSSATIDAASGTPFLDVAVGSILVVQPSTQQPIPDVRTVITHPSDTQVTVDAVVDWSGNGATGFSFDVQNLTDGTGLGSGWFNTSTYASKLVYFGIAQQNTTTGITVQIECKTPGGLPVKVWPEATGTAQCDADGVFTTATIVDRCLIQLPDAPYDRCRIGFKLTSTDDGGDTGANRESVYATFTGVAR